MSKRSKIIRRRRYFIQHLVCQVCGSKHAEHYWLPDSDPATDKPDDVYCAEHARTWYCLGCGNFCAGTESFDFIHPGYCDNCHHEVRDDFDEEECCCDDDDGEGWCDTCHNTGSLDCYCGGDICVCDNNGEMPCPTCHRGF